MSSASAEQANSHDLMVVQEMPVERPTPLMEYVGHVRQRTPQEMVLDEGVDYFSAQGALDRWRARDGR